jgi:hypothetical protein
MLEKIIDGLLRRKKMEEGRALGGERERKARNNKRRKRKKRDKKGEKKGRRPTKR